VLKIGVLSKSPYHFCLGQNVLEPFFEETLSKEHKWAIFCDENIYQLYGKKLYEELQKKGEVLLFTFPAGEKSKSREQKQRLEDFLFENSFGKKDKILALGGGVTLDLAGFVSSTYLRGVAYFSIPTSLLAMIDACIGGKTAINTPYGKNLLGTIYPPKKGCIDISFLQTLPLKEMQEGLAEGVKHALIYDHFLWDTLTNKVEPILAKEEKILLSFVERNVRIKAHIVSQDEEEKGIRYILNFGHTVGHALEKMAEYQISHGSALYWGMLMEAFISMQKGFLAKTSYQEMLQFFQTKNLLAPLPNWDEEKFKRALVKDKKNQEQKIAIVILEKIGKAASLSYFSQEEVMNYLTPFIEKYFYAYLGF